MTVIQQQEIDPHYFTNEADILDKIQIQKEKLQDSLLILGHHYQQENIYKFADMTGDSLKLARYAAETGAGKKFIVFCGVHFMAETADILTGPEQAVILPDLRAGCPMADMADAGDVEYSWEELNGIGEKRIIPVTYVNSSATIKAFVGRNGGSVCTSSNAEKVLLWALERGEKVFFFPDEHLGRNSAHALGMGGEDVILWQRGLPLGGNTVEEIQRAKVLLWDGYCTVHMQFKAAHVNQWREKDPQIQVIVHPECRREVVELADYYGSTEKIIKTVSDSPPGSKWAIGTEVNLVERLRRQQTDKEIHILSPFQCLCATMYRIKPGYLLWTLDNLIKGNIVNRIGVDEPVAIEAKLALDRMLSI